MNQRKNILFISSWYPNRNNSTHGIFNRFFAQAANHNNNVYIIHAVSESNCLHDFELQVKNEFGFEEVVVYFKKTSNPISKYFRYLKAYQLALNYFLNKKIKFNLIHCNVVLNAGIAALKIKKQLSIPLVVNENWTGYLPEDGNYKGFFKTTITKKVVKNSALILPVTEHLKKAMLSHGLANNYKVIPNVCNTNLFRIIEKQISSTIRFIHISALVNAQKNILGLLAAFKQALYLKQNIELAIVGQGGDELELKNYVSKNKLSENVFFVGRKVGEELVQEINKADCLLMFSNYENLPLVILECMACGKPVISTNVGGIAEAVNSTNGILINSGNELELTNAILYFNKENYQVQEIRKKVIENYSSEVIGKALNGAYTLVLNS